MIGEERQNRIEKRRPARAETQNCLPASCAVSAPIRPRAGWSQRRTLVQCRGSGGVGRVGGTSAPWRQDTATSGRIGRTSAPSYR